jgi:hypothetical protein
MRIAPARWRYVRIATLVAIDRLHVTEPGDRLDLMTKTDITRL